MTTPLPFPASQDVQTVLAADTPLRIDPPINNRIMTVRGGLGTFQNQDSGAGDRLDYTKEKKPGEGLRQIVFQNTGAQAQVLLGPMAEQIFQGDTGVDPVTNEITLMNHGFTTGDGPVHFTGDDIPDGINTFAMGQLIVFGNPGNAEAVTIDGKIYIFQTVLTDVDGNVLIGATIDDSLDNLVAAITLGAGSGSLYATSTTLHPTVTASRSVSMIMQATAKNEGAAGNLITTTESLAMGTWGAPTLQSGQDLDYFVIRLDDDTFQIALTRVNAVAGVVVDITADGSGDITVSGVFNVGFPPTASILNGASGFLLEDGDTRVLPMNRPVTLVGDVGASTTFYFA